MAESVKFTQDMPPKGGYGPINFSRVAAKTYFSAPTMFLGFVGITATSLYLFTFSYGYRRNLRLEMKDSRIALEPLFLAERDRMLLKQLHKNREHERELMKDVPGWETGKLYGEPIFKTISPDKFMDPLLEEYYAHHSDWDLFERLYSTLLN